MLIQGIMFNYEDDFLGYRQRFIRAWGMVNIFDTKTLGPNTSIPMEPYLKWVRARAQNLMMPYTTILPVIVEPITEEDVPYTILHPDMPTDLEEFHRSWIQMKEEPDTLRDEFYTSEKKVLELTRQLHEEKSLNVYIDTKRKRPWET